MEIGILRDMEVEAQCGRQLDPHPQGREEWDSGVPENSGHTAAGDKPWAWGCAAAAGQAQELSLGHSSRE